MRIVTILAAALILGGCASSGSSAPRDPSDREVLGIDWPSDAYRMIEIRRDEGTSTATVDAPVQRVWSELAAVYTELGLTPDRLTVYDPGSHRIGTAGRRTRTLGDARLSSLVRCGHSLGVPKADNGQARIDLETRLEPEGEGRTRVTTRFAARVRDVGTSSHATRCPSNGRLERAIVGRLRERLGNEDPSR